jgi:hypothetical protein
MSIVNYILIIFSTVVLISAVVVSVLFFTSKDCMLTDINKSSCTDKCGILKQQVKTPKSGVFGKACPLPQTHQCFFGEGKCPHYPPIPGKTPVGCVNDYGADMSGKGTKVCCNQTGDNTDPAYVCPALLPKCVDYKLNDHFGRCVQEGP